MPGTFLDTGLVLMRQALCWSMWGFLFVDGGLMFDKTTKRGPCVCPCRACGGAFLMAAWCLMKSCWAHVSHCSVSGFMFVDV